MGCKPAPCLKLLRIDADRRYPQRNRASDGICGKASGHVPGSDHPAGNAIDLTHDPVGGIDALAVFEEVCRQMRAFPAGRVKYAIYRRRIASQSSLWVPRIYHGPNPHLTHIHLSIHAGQRLVLRPWSILGRQRSHPFL